MPDETKQFELSNRLFVVFAILLVGVLGFWTAKVFIDFQSLPNNYPREITVSGEGRTFAVPDIALIQLGAVTEGLEVGDVVRENTEKMNNILKEIKTLGIEEKDIKTTTYNLAPRYEWTEDGKRIFKGYTLTQQISVKIRNFE
ncbi:MAG TPA: SIMPL domain-containing protein, partial [Candidatus Lokiarchaeia archaeon]